MEVRSNLPVGSYGPLLFGVPREKHLSIADTGKKGKNQECWAFTRMPPAPHPHYELSGLLFDEAAQEIDAYR
jgi:hypothetical protein